MVATMLPLGPEPWATAPATDSVLLLEQLATLRLDNAALRAQNAVLQERIREEARLGQTSTNSSRPPSADPPQVPARPKGPASGRKRGGQLGHRGTYRALLPVEQVDEVVTVVPEVCRHCGQAAVVNVDETGWRQAQQRAWLWTVMTPEVTVFLIDRSQGGVVLADLLGTEYADVVGSDRWSA